MAKRKNTTKEKPILLYHGSTPIRKESPSILFPTAPAALLRYVPTFDYEIIDVASIDDKTIAGLRYLQIRNILLALKYGRNDAFIEQHWKKIVIFAPDIRDEPLTLTLFRATVVYMSKVSTTFNHKIRDMDNVLTSSEQEVFKPYVVELFEQGMEKGIEKGMEQGIEKALLSFMGKNMDWPDDKIANLFDVPVSLVEKLRNMLTQNR